MASMLRKFIIVYNSIFDMLEWTLDMYSTLDPYSRFDGHIRIKTVNVKCLLFFY